ncbi:formylmethanofuran dehydrogenase subunit A [Bradyrhizobium sp. AZCC 2230]
MSSAMSGGLSVHSHVAGVQTGEMLDGEGG